MFYSLIVYHFLEGKSMLLLCAMKENESLIIQGLGGKRVLEGEIPVNGAKNEALKAMAAAVLFRDELKITNVPEIEDALRMGELLEGIGMKVERRKDTLTIRQGENISSEIPEEISKRFRASVVATGPILARTGRVVFPHPGGCIIGARPIDIFLESFKKMGALVETNDQKYEITASNGLHGANIFFRKYSVTATETLMMAAVLAKGKTILENSALEPEIAHLAEYLNSCGAKISGAGTSTINIEGGELLASSGREYKILPDRIEAGSFLILASIAGKDIAITHCNPDHLGALIETLRTCGVDMEIGETVITVKNHGEEVLRAVDIVQTREYPGFPTDLQAPMAVLLTQAEGESIIFETIYDGRLNYAPELVRMGADIVAMDTHRILVKGKTALSGRNLESPDIRAGLAYIIAGIYASGKTVIHNVYLIDRGYAKIEKRLQAIGAQISRE